MAASIPAASFCLAWRLATLAVLTAGLPSPCPAQAYLGWLQHPTALAPSARAAHVMVYDASRGRMVLFGGWNNVGPACCALGETWEWDGAVWLLRQPATTPSPRMGAAAVYDAQRHRVVLFGGSDGTNYFADTWEWDGVDWTQRLPAASPPPRWLPGATYDVVRDEVVVFGGFDGTNHRDDTWVWDGTNWTQRQVAFHPLPRKQPAMVYDAAAGVTVLFGGEQGAGAFYNDTWTWDGVQWAMRSPGTSPGLLWGPGAAFDPLRGRVVLFGGCGPTAVTDAMWEWDGTTWDLHGAVLSPAPRQNPGFAFWSTGEAVLFGGLVTVGTGALADTWGFRGDQPASYASFGSGCAGSLGTPQLGRHPGFAQLPWIGTTFGLRVTNVPPFGVPPLMVFGWSNTTFQGQGLPLHLDSLGMPGCWLSTAADILLWSTRNGSTASLLLTLPPAAAILGTRFYGQALVFDPGANPAGATLSNAGEVVVGSR